jgi:hypothetical protein
MHYRAGQAAADPEDAQDCIRRCVVAVVRATQEEQQEEEQQEEEEEHIPSIGWEDESASRSIERWMLDVLNSVQIFHSGKMSATATY